MNLFSLITRSFSKSTNITPKISVVGSGPAGFYAVQYLLKKLQKCEIDIYERLPVPFGLVRFGVAPDHPEVKNVENTFKKLAEHPNVRFLGNVNLGKDIFIKDLKEAYHIIILAYGAEEHKKLNIPGENLNNVISARRIVGWYNGVPWDKDISLNLTGENAVIFGQGNVAIDVARILLTPIDDLKKTDITQHSLEALSKSKIKKVCLVGRRGPLQAAFTIKELREMLKLKNCQTEWKFDDFHGINELLPNLSRPKRRICELMLKSATEFQQNNRNNVFKPVFFRSPLELIGENCINRVKLGITELKGDDFLNPRAILTNSHENLECDLGIISIGYKSIPVDSSLKFDNNLGIIKNDLGKIEKGLYATGWLATGPVGVILTTMNNSFTIAENILKEINEDSTLIQSNKPGYEFIETILKNKNVQIVSWKDWLKIDHFEVKEGAKIGKPREKIVDIREMLRIAS